MRITAIDWIIFIVLTLGLVAVGYITRQYTKSVADWTVAGRKLRVWLGLSATSAEGIAIASIVTLAQQGYLKGFAYVWMLTLTLLLCVPLIGIYGFGIKRYRATGVQTLPQYYEMRYSRGVRILAGIAIVIGGVLNMAIFPIIAAQFLSAFLGFPDVVHAGMIAIKTTHIIMLLVIGLSVFFVLTGGFVTVVVTNYIQAVIMSVAIFSVTYLCIRHLGHDFGSGLSRMHDTLAANIGKGAFVPFAAGGYGMVWILFFVASNIFGTLAFPPSLMMTSGAESPEVARKMYLIRIITNNGRGLCLLLWGIAALSMFGNTVPAGEDSELYQRIVTPKYLGMTVPPILIGITLAGLIFAEIGTTSGYILSWCSIIVNDVVCSVRKTPFTTKEHIRALRISFLGVAVFLFIWGIYYKPSESVLTYAYLTGAIFTGAGIISFYGLYWKRTTTAAAYCALIICMVVPIADLILKQQWDSISFLKTWRPVYPLKGEESGLLAMVLSVAAIHVISWCSNKKTQFEDYGAKLRQIEERDRSIIQTPAH